MKQSILKFLAFLEPEWMRNFMHALIGYSLGYGFAILTGITDFIHHLDVILGCIGMSIFMGVGAFLYEDKQSTIFESKFSWNDIFVAMTFCFLGGSVSALLYESVSLAWIQIIVSAILFSLEIVRLATQKLMK